MILFLFLSLILITHTRCQQYLFHHPPVFQKGDTLKIFGSHTETEEVSENGDSGSEQQITRSSHFYQSITLPAPVDLDQSHAKLFKNGKLKITLPRVTPLK